MKMKDNKKNETREYGLISICGVAVIIIATLIKEVAKRPEFSSSKTTMIMLTVLCLVVTAMSILLAVRLLKMSMEKYKNKKR